MSRGDGSELYDALGTFWAGQLDLMAREVPAVAAGRDAEALHRYRVALRRTRSLLKLFRPLLPEGERDIDALDAGLGWLGTATGAVRDLDVLMLAARERQLAALQPVLARLQVQRLAAQRELRRVLRGARLRTLLRQWGQFIERLPHGETPPAARVRLKKLLDVQRLRLALWLLRHGSRIDGETPARELHRLRIRAKRLRYLVEAFPDGLSVRRGKSLRSALVELQDRLGTHQDAAATGERLRQLRAASGELPAETVQALDAWLHELERTRQAARAGLLPALQRFGAAACAAL